jgi:hypothetical protein
MALLERTLAAAVKDRQMVTPEGKSEARVGSILPRLSSL